MNYYLNTFENITQSVERLLKDEQNSLEIKQSATSLRQAIQPCIEELKQSATRLKELILVCSDELYHAVALKIDNFITAIFDDRVKLSTEAIAKAIAFYNDFLEQQERYQQETPEQREAEKAWIEQQRQELARIQGGIEVIFNAG